MQIENVLFINLLQFALLSFSKDIFDSFNMSLWGLLSYR